MADETIDLNDPVVRELIDGAHADAMKLRGNTRRLRTQAERDADGTTWRATAATRPGYATYPTTPPGNPSWWRGQPPTPATAADGGPPPGDHDRCTKWCGFCHLGPEPQPERTSDGPGLMPPIPDSAYPPDAVDLPAEPRSRWWHRYTRRNV